MGSGQTRGVWGHGALLGRAASCKGQGSPRGKRCAFKRNLAKSRFNAVLTLKQTNALPKMRKSFKTRILTSEMYILTMTMVKNYS